LLEPALACRGKAPRNHLCPCGFVRVVVGSAGRTAQMLMPRIAGAVVTMLAAVALRVSPTDVDADKPVMVEGIEVIIPPAEAGAPFDAAPENAAPVDILPGVAAAAFPAPAFFGTIRLAPEASIGSAQGEAGGADDFAIRPAGAVSRPIAVRLTCSSGEASSCSEVGQATSSPPMSDSAHPQLGSGSGLTASVAASVAVGGTTATPAKPNPAANRSGGVSSTSGSVGQPNGRTPDRHLPTIPGESPA